MTEYKFEKVELDLKQREDINRFYYDDLIIVPESFKPDAYDVVGDFIQYFWTYLRHEGVIVRFKQSYYEDFHDYDTETLYVELDGYDRWEDNPRLDEYVPVVVYEWDWNEGQRYIKDLEIIGINYIEIPKNTETDYRFPVTFKKGEND